MSSSATKTCEFCGTSGMATAFVYDRPPKGETKFAFSDSPSYHREFLLCDRCGHYRARQSLDLTALYQSDYVTSTYGGEGLRRNFDRINALPPDKSDNVGRVRRVNEWTVRLKDAATAKGRPPRVLDVGSGLCVFLYRMKAEGWSGTALEPDPRFAAHARDVVGVEAVSADFMTADGLGRYDLVSFNKVLEHVVDPVAMLRRAASFLEDEGAVYVELPDGEAAGRAGADREEFFIEHYHAFSFASLALLARSAGFAVVCEERLQEPSTKFTLRAMLRVMT